MVDTCLYFQFQETNEIKKEPEKSLKLYTRNAIHVEYKRESDTSINKGGGNHVTHSENT